ncbi:MULTISPECIES: DUF4395 domain-containing protein [unclassified Nocardioides]|uniref:DUF4395 domain-containing protein n=1 Tax=unclassified Nocardioides TaxID=2615069 RepID=UPI0006F70E26|nr:MULTISPECIES: DUF4395 domain-containing protein [unclassified Nocardioides]KRA38848.1 hypothetical protein ASD81_09730 [Nocardioides sp. Root614]KRA92808.1 hypothetical protein ASD84_09995 [Nocardioides sp. Root682]
MTTGVPESLLRRTFSFPHPVNEKAARVVAGGVVAIATSALLLGRLVSTDWLWLSLPLALGFVARALTGPTLSPLGRLASSVIAPRLGPAKSVAGPPKRFAQVIGAVVTGFAAAAVAFDQFVLAEVLLGLIIVAAGLEAFLAFCLGCTIFGWLMRAGLVPQETCEACNNLALRRA